MKNCLMKSNARYLTISRQTWQQLDASNKEADWSSTRKQNSHKFASTPRPPFSEPFSTRRNRQSSDRASSSEQPYRITGKPDEPKSISKDTNQPPISNVSFTVDGQTQSVSTILLRDLCECPRCVDSSTKQKLFSTVDIPSGIRARAIAQTKSGVSLLWDQDVPGYGRDHTTELRLETLRTLGKAGAPSVPETPEPQRLWDAEDFGKVQDIDYEAYMQDDAVLYEALRQLHTHGLLFLTNVPGQEKSVSTIAERIGPVKNTFYGYTWDVRSVPQAKNVAYTSQDLGFHMDLLYMQQPPHLQFLHCIRSSSAGGASLFTDSYKAASDLYATDTDAFIMLAKQDVNFHYYHPSSNMYHQRRKVLELRALGIGMKLRAETLQILAGPSSPNDTPIVLDWIKGVSWAPPFQAPFSTKGSQRNAKLLEGRQDPLSALERLNANTQQWHAAAGVFNALLHRPEGIFERMMKPGECVIFDNRRVLHGRKAFEVADSGKERWLRGAYLDRDPYISKLRVLQQRFGRDGARAGRLGSEVSEEYFATAAVGDA